MGYREQFAQALQQMGTKQDPVQAQYEAQLMKESQPNQFKGAIATIDALNGTNFTGQLPKEVSKKERLAELLQMRQGQESQKLKGLQALAGMESDAADKAQQRAFQEKMYGLQLAKATQKASAPIKLGSEEKKQVGLLDGILDDLPKFKAAIQRGETFKPEIMGMSIGGDNEAMLFRRSIMDALSKYRSGASTSASEERIYNSLVGAFMDSPEMALKKIDELENMVKRSRQTTINGPSAEYSTAARNPSMESNEDAEAFAWASQNPNDPRAQQILQGMRK